MTAPVEDELTAVRRAQAAETLSVEASRWRDELPPSVRPRLLPVEFPRIANALSRRWRTQAACLAYFDEVLIDKRGQRRGFPMAIVLEIAAHRPLASSSRGAIKPTRRAHSTVVCATLTVCCS